MLERRTGRIKAASPGKLTGYAAVFASESRDLGGFTEVIRPGAFTNSLGSGRNVRALWQHNGDALLGTTSGGTLRLTEDDHGLRFDLELPDTSHGRDLAILVERGDVSGCSFGFRVDEDRWEQRADKWLRELIRVDLHEVTLTHDPAYVDTEVALRSLNARRQAADLRRLWLLTV